MVCPKCHSAKNHIYNSRPTKRTNQTWRRRRCDACKFAFSTREYIEADQFLHVVKDGKNIVFSRVKLLLSIAQACAHFNDKPDIAFYLLGTIENDLLEKSEAGAITTELITTTTLEVLQRFDTKAYLTYLATYPTIQDSRDLHKLLKKRAASSQPSR